MPYALLGVRGGTAGVKAGDDMPSIHHDEARDYGFADRALVLRMRAGLTQSAVANLLGVSVRALHAWENGLSYPETEHLKHLIALYVERGTFAAGREEEEAAALWTSVRGTVVRRAGPFDLTWFASLRGTTSGSLSMSPTAHVAGVAAAPALASPTSTPSANLQAQGATVPLPRHDWGDAPDVPLLQGRTAELHTLADWVREEHCRVVEVVGAGGIGKTALASRLAHELAPEFPILYWRSLRNALPAEEWLDAAISALSAAHALPPKSLEAKLELLLELLRTRRGLLVLDNLETVLEPGAPMVQYRAGYEGYGEVLRQLSQSVHRGCLLVTSREQPLREDQAAIRALRLEGLGVEDSRALLDGRALSGDEAAWRALVERYAGNPLVLRLVGETISSVFEGEIAAFLAQEVAVFGGIRHLLDEQVARLSALEQAVLAWLAVEREPIGFPELVADLLPPPFFHPASGCRSFPLGYWPMRGPVWGPGMTRAQVVEVVEALRRSSLLELGGPGSFTLQPVVLEYMTARLVAQVSREVLAGDPALLVSHALVKAQSKDYVRHSQEQLLAQPLLEELRGRGGSEEAERRLLVLLDGWRGREWAEQGYGPGNVVNLLRLLRGHLRGLDLSRLSLRQAYLQGIEVQDSSLVSAHLSEAVLTEAFNYGLSIALSANGHYLATGTSTGEVYLWRLADRTLLLATRGHIGPVPGVALSRDGGVLASSSFDGTVKLWEPSSGRLLTTLRGHARGVWGVALSQDGQLVASGNFDGTVNLWESSTGRLVATLQGPTAGVMGVALSQDGELVASGSYDGTVTLWEISSSRLGESSVAINEQLPPILSTAPPNRSQGRLLTHLQGHSGAVRSVALSSDGRLVASGSYDGTIRLWEAHGGACIAILHGHSSAIHGVALSGDGRLLTSGSEDGTVKLWEVPSGRLLTTLRERTGAVEDVALSAAGRMVAACGQDGVSRLWELPSGRLLATLQGYTDGIWTLALSIDSQLVVSGGFDGTVKLWEVASARLLATLQGHTSGVPAVALARDGRLVVSGSFDRTIKLWELPSGRLLATLSGHSSGVHSLTLSDDGRLLASGSGDGTVKLWELPSGRLLTTLSGHASGVQSVALSGDGGLLASGSYDGTVKLWEVPSRRPLVTLEWGTGGIWSVALSKDGRLLVSGSEDGTVTLWEVTSGRLQATLQGHTSAVYSVALSADGRLLASASYDGTVKLWETPNGRPLATLQGHASTVCSVALSGDGRLLASGGQDGTVRLWEAVSGAGVLTLRVDRCYERMDITGLNGVTEAQRATLLALGAIDRETMPGTVPAPTQVASSHATAAAWLSVLPPEPGPVPLAHGRPPTNLPAARTTFVGRATDLAALTQALRPQTGPIGWMERRRQQLEHTRARVAGIRSAAIHPAAGTGTRLLTLTGVAGSGKTRLALAVAQAMRDVYPDGVWLVELAPLPASLAADLAPAVGAVLAALDLQEQPGREPLETLIAYLRSRRLLLLLDNCEHVVAAVAALALQLLGAGPDLRILATSQQPLGIAEETVWRVPALDLPTLRPVEQPWKGSAAMVEGVPTEGVVALVEQSDAVRLFVERAQAMRPDFALNAATATSVAAICRQLDGLPLAIELAAARLHVLPVEQLLKRLDDRFRLLRRGGRSATDRHQTLQATMDWSYGLLEPAEQAVLRRLAVFAGGWELAAAEAVCAEDEVEARAVLELLDVLQDWSLVYVYEADGAPRYGILETVRQYGLLQLERAGEMAVTQDRHLHWCMALAEQAAPRLQGPGQDVWLARLEREHDNLRAALRWSLGAEASDSTALQLAGALVRFWIMHAHFSEGRHWLGKALAAEAGTAAERARALGGAALLAEGQSAYEEATRMLDESLGLWRALGDQAGSARALANQGLVAGWQGDFGRARVLLEEALAIFRALKAQDDMAETLTTLGIFVEVQGDAVLAWTLLEEGLSVFRAMGDGRGVAQTLGWMALTARRHGEYARALTLYEEALTRARAVGDRRGVARWLNGLALSLASQGEYDRAQALLEESLALSRAQRDLRNTAASFNDLGEIARKQGAYGRAQGLFEESQALQRQLGDSWGIANTHRNLADVAEKDGDTERAARLLAQSLAGFQEVGDRWGVAYCLELGGRVAAACGRWSEAAQLLAGAVALRETIGTHLEPDEIEAHEHLLQTITSVLGEERFTELWTRGSALPLEDLLATLAIVTGTDAAAGEADRRWRT
jgi:WD40 repeat protein/predicted ATPase/transcriptional regulator with XRE-family HTH domain/Tfp pilus assembly protein PilF